MSVQEISYYIWDIFKQFANAKVLPVGEYKVSIMSLAIYSFLGYMILRFFLKVGDKE